MFNKSTNIIIVGIICLVVILILNSILDIFPSSNCQLNEDEYATIIDSCDGIKKTDLEDRVSQRTHLLESGGQKVIDTNLIQQESLDLLIDRKLTKLYANSKEITVPEIELVITYDSLIKKYNSEEEFLKEISIEHGFDKDQYLAELEFNILKTYVTKATDLDYAEFVTKERSKHDIEILLDD